MRAPLDPAGPGPVVRAIARTGRRALGVILLALAIGLTTWQVL